MHNLQEQNLITSFKKFSCYGLLVGCF